MKVHLDGGFCPRIPNKLRKIFLYGNLLFLLVEKECASGFYCER